MLCAESAEDCESALFCDRQCHCTQQPLHSYSRIATRVIVRHDLNDDLSAAIVCFRNNIKKLVGLPQI